MPYPLLKAIAAAVVLLGTAVAPSAQDFPTKSITWIVPYTPGGITDTRARQIGEVLAEELGQTVLIENRPGAGGTVGLGAAARSRPDGYTVVYGTLGTLAAAPSLYKDLPYNPLEDFVPIHMMANSNLTVIAHPDRPYNTLAELAAYAKEHPGEVTVGLSGIGTMTHLASELFMNTAGIEMLKVPYQGSSPAMTDLVGGRLDVVFDYQVSTQGHFDAGSVKILGVTSPERMEAFPDAPTMAESGFGDATTGSWAGLYAPAGTPPEVVAILTDAFDKAMKSDTITTELMKSGSEPLDMDGQEMTDFLAKELETWTRVIKDAGISQN